MTYTYIPGAAPAGQNGRATVRQSNIELLRIVAMMLVLIVHADFLALGAPDAQALKALPAESGLRVWIQGFALVCVDVFVMISGYFGIRPSVRGVLNFAFQIIFWRIAVAIVAVAAGFASYGAVLINLVPFAGDWFSPCYMLLMLVSPALNAFVEKLDLRAMGRYLLIFFALQTAFGWVPGAVYSGGSSLISMIGLYMLGRYVKLHLSEERRRRVGVSRGLLLYILIVTVNSIAYCVGTILLEGTFLSRSAYSLFMAYSSPLNIAASVALIVAFSNIELKSRIINSLAKSAYSVLLIHLNPLVFGFYLAAWQAVYRDCGAATWFAALIPGCAAVYLACTVADRVRIFLWERIMFYWHKQDKAVKNL
ncbi:MAG: acyltransferase [Muribaculaceae bacterium]